MIVSDEYIIATPSKCGTFSIKEACESLNSREWRRPLGYPKPHESFVPEGAPKNAIRALAVRDPYERLVSQWFFIKEEKERERGMTVNPRPWSHVDMSGFEAFAQSVSDSIRENVTWFLPLSSYVQNFKPDEYLRLESLESDLAAFMDRVGSPLARPVARRHVTASRADSGLGYEDLVTPKVSTICTWVHEDAELLGYPTR